MMFSICEKVKLQQSRKEKYSILVSILDLFNFFLTEPHAYLYNTLCKSHHFLISCFESFKKCDFLEKIILPLFF